MNLQGSNGAEVFRAIKGEMAGRIRALDWSGSPLGPVETWSPVLIHTVGLLLPAQAQIVLFWGPEFVALYNDAYAPSIGDKHPRALGRPARENWSELWQDLEPLLRGVRETGETFFAEDRPFYIERHGGAGETAYFDVSYSLVREADGSSGGVLCIVSETTKRVRAQQKMRTDHDRFAEMFRQAPSFMAQLEGPEHIFKFANDAYQQLIGHRDVIGKTIREGFPDIAGQGFYELLDEVYRTGEPFVGRGMPVTLDQGDGPENVLLDFVYQPIKAIDGGISGIFVEGFDVTDQRAAGQSLQRSEERVRLATENAGIGLWDIDADDGIDFSYSRRSSSFVMARGERVPLSHLLKHLHPDDVPKFQTAYDAARDPAQRAMMDVEYRVLPDGTAPLRWIKVRGRGVFADDGACLRVSGTALEITKERETQEALARSEEQLRLATEHAEIGMWDVDNVANTLIWTKQVRDAFGVDPDVPVTMDDFYEGLHPDDRAATSKAFADANDPEKRALYDVEYRTVGKNDGLIRWVHAKGRGVFDESGRCVRVTGTALDITRRKNAEEQLRRSEELLRLATDNAEIGMWDMDVIHNTNYSQPRVKAMFGMSPEDDPLPEEFFKLVHEEDVERVLAAYDDAFDPVKRATYDVNYRVIGRDGVQRWIQARGRGVFGDDGTCLRVVGTAMDITKEREIAEALRRNEEQLRLATEHAEVGLWDIDLVNDVVYWPPRVKAMFGFPLDAPVAMKQFRAALHPEDKRRTIDAILSACDPARRDFYDAEYRIVRKTDGEVRWMSAKGRAMFDGKGTCVRMLGIILDITERKIIEQRLHELNETLEQRVAERSAALERSQAALQQAQKMEAIGNLTGGIAHDFNNLLQGLTGSLDLIRRKPADMDRVRRWAEAGLQAAERGAKLTAQLLAFSRSQKLEMKALDVTALLSGMRELLARTLGPSVQVTLELSPQGRAVLGDETQLEMAILNLAINARDAMDGTGALTIRTNPRSLGEDGELEAGDYIELSVADTGCGMPADVVARAFDPFFTTKEVGKGTGLGLSQVYGMARQAGGTVRIASVPGEGTTVHIFLRATGMEAAQESRTSQEHAEATSRATILVVDDDPDVRRFLTESLDTFGYKTVAAADGAAGLDILDRMRPDLLIVDYAMPGMTGAQLAAQARTKHPGLPILFASGYAETTALENALDGKAPILRKPFRLDALQTTVARILSGP